VAAGGRVMQFRLWGWTALAAVLLVSGSGLVVASAAGPAPEGPFEVELVIRHSRFLPGTVEVPAGRVVRFTVVNTDPIAHELIVGPRSVQDAHETGTDAVHGDVPGEVSVAPGGRATTTYRPAIAEPILLGCHLPGHWDYGMQGMLTLT